MTKSSSDKQRNWRIFKQLGLLFIVVSLASACYEKQEGCLDIAATNFEVEADRECDDCCSYPSLQVTFAHRVRSVQQDTFFNLNLGDSLYTLNGIDFFRFSDIRFYISDFQLIQADGTALTTSDQIELTLFENGDTLTQNTTDDFALVSRTNLSPTTIGTIRPEGNFSGIRFKIGVTSPANHADPTAFPNIHPLAEENDLHWSIDSGYVFNRIALFRDTVASDTIPTVLEIGTDELLRTVELDYPFPLKIGFNATVALQIDYLTWFQGVDIRNDSEAAMIEKIVGNITDSFTVLDVSSD